MIKILIVEDDRIKSDEIKTTLLNHFQSGLAITLEENVIGAKKRLLENQYDFLLLDLNLPIEDAGQCSKEAGYSLYNEIKKIKAYKMPKHVLFCTAYDELHKNYQDDIDNGKISILKYNAAGDTWRHVLIEKITDHENLTKSENVQVMNYNFDVAILTAVSVEYEYARMLIEDIEEIRFLGDTTTYFSGKIDGKKVVLAKQHQMGMTSASLLSSKIINHFRPKFLVMVGIAAGRKGKCQLGDIIVPYDVWDYSSGKITSEANPDNYSEMLFQPAPTRISIDVGLKEMIDQSDFSSIINKIELEWRHTRVDNKLKIEIGTMACGPAVIQNDEVVKQYIDVQDRKYIAIDMESYGVMYAANNCYGAKPKGLIIKSVCDYADSSKNDDYQRYASFTSSRFLYHLIKEGYLN